MLNYSYLLTIIKEQLLHYYWQMGFIENHTKTKNFNNHIKIDLTIAIFQYMDNQII